MAAIIDGHVEQTSGKFIDIQARVTTGEGELKEYHDCRYLSYRPSGISFCFDKSLEGKFPLAAIHLYNAGNKDKYLAFPHCHLLPYNIAPDITLQHIVEKFSPLEPEKGGGSRTGLGIWIKYASHGIMFQFDSKSWQDPNAVWIECTLFAPVAV